ncbi:MAG: DUF1501 domain-containing protein [Planctomycetaceae bacterium]|nr:DUF1501 domain-containing protein [Planctomycetaceae bacterium]
MSSLPVNETELMTGLARRAFLKRSTGAVGAMALASLLSESRAATGEAAAAVTHKAKAKRVIYMFQSGAPSQQDLFDYKPAMQEYFDKDLPPEVRNGQRLTTMSSGQSRFPIAPTKYQFQQHGESGAWLSELLPHIAEIADDACFVKSMHTEAINHDPAMTFFQTGSQIAGRPSMGSWVSYGLGSMNENLPTYVALSSRGSGRPSCQPLYDRLWGSGFLPTVYSGVKFRGQGDPVLYLSNPAGVDRALRRQLLDDINRINEENKQVYQDPEIDTRIAQYELAYRMQASVPELIDFSDEPKHILEMYGPDVHRRGSYAYNALLSRRMLERGVRFVQTFHMGWDQHANMSGQLPGQCRDADQPSAALVKDLKQRGMLDDTLVVWGGEFGRTIYCQGKLSRENYGRDHHPRCFTIWLAGGGIQPGTTYGATDDFSYNIVENPVHVHDLHATILHLMGVDHERLTYRYQGRNFRLTDVHGELVHGIMS